MYRTAITRIKASVPTRWLIENDLIRGRVLDYGCGRGKDAEVLDCEKFDPYYAPDMPKGKFDTIVCNYVLNVVTIEEENEIINDIKKRLRKNGNAYISVRRDNFKPGFNGRSYQRWSKPELIGMHTAPGYEMYVIKG